MSRLASEDEQAECRVLGRQVLAILEPFVQRLLPADAPDDDVIYAASSFAVSTIALALEDRTQIARVSMVQGIGFALGSMESEAAQHGASILGALLASIKQGVADGEEARNPAGQA